jgi:hypothetical protein
MNRSTPPHRDVLAALGESSPLSAPPAGADFSASRTAALAALRARPREIPWTRHATVVTAFGLGATLIGALVTALVGGPAARLVDARLPTVASLALLLGAQAVALWAAVRPGRWWGATMAWSAAAVGAALLVGLRAATTGQGQAVSDAGGWICSASHLAVGLAPAVVMLSVVRRIAWSLPRALTAGLAVGISGLVWGEIACERSWNHVLVSHVGAMALMVLGCALASRLLSRGAFAR